MSVDNIKSHIISNCRWYQTADHIKSADNIKLQMISNCTAAFWQLRSHMLHSVHEYWMNMRNHMLHFVSIWNEYHAVYFDLQYCFLSNKLIETFRNFLWVSDHKISIQNYSNVDIKIQNSTDKKLIRFHEIVFYKNFVVNLKSFCQFHNLNYWWDNRSEFNHIHKINQKFITVIILTKLHE